MMDKNYLGFLGPKIWKILKLFPGYFRRAQTLKLLGVRVVLINAINAKTF